MTTDEMQLDTDGRGWGRGGRRAEFENGGRGAINCEAVRQTGACKREMYARIRGPRRETLAGLGPGT